MRNSSICETSYCRAKQASCRTVVQNSGISDSAGCCHHLMYLSRFSSVGGSACRFDMHDRSRHAWPVTHIYIYEYSAIIYIFGTKPRLVESHWSLYLSVLFNVTNASMLKWLKYVIPRYGFMSNKKKTLRRDFCTVLYKISWVCIE